MSFGDKFAYYGTLAGSTAIMAAMKAKHYYDSMKPLNQKALRGAYHSLRKKNNNLMAPVSRKRKANGPTATVQPNKVRKLGPNKPGNYARRIRRNSVPVLASRKRSFKGYVNGRISKPKSKRAAYNKDKTFMQHGIIHREERAGVTTTTSEAVYVGHITHPSRLLVNLIWKAIAKKLFQKMGIYAVTPDEGFAMPADATLSITFKAINDGVMTTTPVVPGTSWSINLVANALNAVFLANIDSVDFMLMSLDFTGGTTTGGTYSKCRIPLSNATLAIDVTSSFSIQNRTLTTSTDGSTDNVNNQPLIGKSYYGTGSGTRAVSTIPGTSSDLFADALYGVIDIQAGTQGFLQEPPSRAHFPNVTKTGGVILQPGEVKTGKINKAQKISLNKIIRLLATRANTGVLTKFNSSLGLFQFYGLEKMVDCVETQPDITVGYEHNLSIKIMLKLGREYMTVQSYNKSFK